MISFIEAKYITNNKVYSEIVGLSTDSIDVTNLANGSLIYLMDTSKYYCFDETAQVFREVGGTGTWPATGPTRTVVLEEQTVTLDAQTPVQLAETELFDVGTEYIVTIDGTEYTALGYINQRSVFLLNLSDGLVTVDGIMFGTRSGATVCMSETAKTITLKIESLGASTKYLLVSDSTISQITYISETITDPSEYVGESVDAVFTNANYGMVSDAIYDDNGTPTFEFAYTKTGDSYYGTIIYFDGTESATEPYATLYNGGAPVGCYLYIPSAYSNITGLAIGVTLPN